MSRTLPQLEASIRQLIEVIENAEDPTAPFLQLKKDISELTSRTTELRDEYYKQRNTIQRQAHTIAENQLADIIGPASAAPAPPRIVQAPAINFPDVITAETRPQAVFVRLSFGFANLIHVTLLDVKARQLQTTTGTRNLETQDVKTLIYHLKNFSI